MSNKTMWLFEPPTKNENYSDEWMTDPAIIEALGEFDLDPCTPEKMPWVTAKKRYTKKDNGLKQEWEGCVWLNPPYSNINPFLERMGNHNNGVLICYCRLDTEWFRKYIWEKATGIFFFFGRIYWYRQGIKYNYNAGGPVCLVAYGEEAFKKIENSGLRGKLLRL